MYEQENLVWLSKQVGQRFDMVQAGGGNTSVKCDNGQMLIKASGFGLSELECDKGISVIFDGVCVSGAKPSMESGMHELLDAWVLHTHPLVVGMLVCRADWADELGKLFPEALLVGYYPPGRELAFALRQKQCEFGCLPEIIFLQNHGLVVHAKSADLVLLITESVLVKLEKFLCVDFSCYRQTTEIANLVKQIVPVFTGIAYLSEDIIIQDVLNNYKNLFDVRPCFPDSFIYGGYEILQMAPGEVQGGTPCQIKEYSLKYNTYPRIIVHNSNVFFLAQSVRKAQESEAVFKAQLLILAQSKKQFQSLALQELKFLAEMSSEKYRQNF